MVIIPTSINVITLVNDNILFNIRRGHAAEISLPSLRRRAKMIVAETGVVAVHEEPIKTPLLQRRLG